MHGRRGGLQETGSADASRVTAESGGGNGQEGVETGGFG